MKNKTISGSCLCGSIAYEVRGLERVTGNCHCTMCRKFHGAAFATYGVAKSKNFSWLKGENFLAEFEAKNGTKRKFCQKCGASLIFEAQDNSGDFVKFALASLDSDINMRPPSHLFTEYKACWFEITDGLPQYREGESAGETT